MANHPPPVPPAGRRPLGDGGPGELPDVPPTEAGVDPHQGPPDSDKNKKGDQANLRQNTRHPGHQQDR